MEKFSRKSTRKVGISISKIDEVSEKLGALHATTKAIHQRLDGIEKKINDQNGQVAKAIKQINGNKLVVEKHLTEHKTFTTLLITGVTIMATGITFVFNLFWKR